MFQNTKNSLKDGYQRVLEKSTIIALILVILIFLMFPRIKVDHPLKMKPLGTSLNFEEIPVTRQGLARKPPPRPVVPIPSEDDVIPNDVTIEDTDLNLDSFSSSSGSGSTLEQITIFQPRPIFEVIPEYPEELQKKGVEGIVKLHLHIDPNGRVIDVIVLENTTNNEVCANAAKVAALKGRYIPAKKDEKTTDLWITRTYTFGLQK